MFFLLRTSLVTNRSFRSISVSLISRYWLNLHEAADDGIYSSQTPSQLDAIRSEIVFKKGSSVIVESDIDDLGFDDSESVNDTCIKYPSDAEIGIAL